ncbi:ABC transporter permease [Clostridia bacterium]|nr:ABC transporter permease [Clostridia bacterium]
MKTANTKFYLSVILTVSGFIAAILVNLFFPFDADKKLSDFKITGNFGEPLRRLPIPEADLPGFFYRLVVLALILLYIGTAIYAFADRDKTAAGRRAKFISRAPFRGAVGVVLALWDIMGSKLVIFQQPFFPGPTRIVEAFIIETDFIWQNTLYSLRLFTFGFILGVFAGVLTGTLIGWFDKAYYWVFPVLKITGVIPAVAWMPFALTLFPSPFSAAVFLIVICAWFPVAFLTASGIKSTPRTYFEAARTLGAKTPYLVFRVALPHALPQIFTGISTALSGAFLTLVMAEMMGQPGGLGYYINASKVWGAYYKVFASIFVMAILFSLIMKAVAFIQRRALRWQAGVTKN